jgi:hypothetical protein
LFQILQQILQQRGGFLCISLNIQFVLRRNGIESTMIDNLKKIARKSVNDIRAAAPTVIDEANSDEDPRVNRMQETFMDAFGFTYHSVRFCDLERISDK